MPQFVSLSGETVLITSVAGNFVLCFLDRENPLFEKLAILFCYSNHNAIFQWNSRLTKLFTISSAHHKSLHHKSKPSESDFSGTIAAVSLKCKFGIHYLTYKSMYITYFWFLFSFLAICRGCRKTLANRVQINESKPQVT